MCHKSTFFPSSSFILFSRSMAKQNQGANVPSLLLSPLLGKSQKFKACLSFPQLRDSCCTYWPSLSWGKMYPPLPLAFPHPAQVPVPRAKARQAYCSMGTCIQPSFTPLNNIMSCGQKVTPPLPVQDVFWSIMVAKAEFPPM